jgi:hypothetical protein
MCLHRSTQEAPTAENFDTAARKSIAHVQIKVKPGTSGFDGMYCYFDAFANAVSTAALHQSSS